MELKVYKSEMFNRNKLRYIIFSSIFIIIFLVSIFYKNIVWAILMFFLLGWYLYYGIINNKEIRLKITKEWLIIWDKLLNWSNFSWYTLEIDTKKQTIKNLVLINKNGHNIHTINDTEENIHNFVENLNNFLPTIWEFPQTFREKAARRMKL